MCSREDTARTAAWVPEMADALVREIFEQVAGIRLQRCPATISPWGETVTVCSAVEGAYSSKFLFQCEMTLVCRVASNMLGKAPDTAEEAGEYIMELFNMFCGRFLSELYRSSGIPARFYPPRCHKGRQALTEENGVTFGELSYRGDSGEHGTFQWTMDAIERLLARGGKEEHEVSSHGGG